MGPERSAFLHSPVAPLHRMPHSTRPPPHTQRSTSTSASRRNHGPTATNLGATVYDGITPTNTTPMRGTCRTTCHPLTPSTLAAGRHRSQRDLQAAPSHREPVRPRHPTGHYTNPATCPTRRLCFLWLCWLQRHLPHALSGFPVVVLAATLCCRCCCRRGRPHRTCRAGATSWFERRRR